MYYQWRGAYCCKEVLTIILNLRIYRTNGRHFNLLGVQMKVITRITKNLFLLTFTQFLCLNGNESWIIRKMFYFPYICTNWSGVRDLPVSASEVLSLKGLWACAHWPASCIIGFLLLLFSLNVCLYFYFLCFLLVASSVSWLSFFVVAVLLFCFLF